MCQCTKLKDHSLPLWDKHSSEEERKNKHIYNMKKYVRGLGIHLSGRELA